MSKKINFLLTIGVFMMSLSSELCAQSTPAPQLEETVGKRKINKALKAPEQVQNVISLQPIRKVKPTIQEEINGIEQQLFTLKKITNPSPFIGKKIKYLEGTVAKKKKSATQTIKSH